MLFNQLFPTCQTIESDALLQSLQKTRSENDRPYVAINMAMTVDGKTTIDHRSGKIGGTADRELFHGLREVADAILAGTTTLAAEQYRRLVRDPERRQRRITRGQKSDPIAVVMSRSNKIPNEIDLLKDPEQPVVHFTGSCAQSIPVVFKQLRQKWDVGYLLCEGGPTLNRALFASGCVDELFLTLGPQVTANPQALPLLMGPALISPQKLELLSILQSENELFLRYRLEPSS